jgi:hypothetical protein
VPIPSHPDSESQVLSLSGRKLVAIE